MRTYSLPIPLTDELALGLISRFAKLNGLPSVDLAIQGIQKFPHSCTSTTLIDKVAEIFEMQPLNFLRRHTLSPFHCSLNEPRGYRYNIKSNSLPIWLETPFKILRWCSVCADQDISNNGFSYWHLNHQLPGLDWCYRHQIPLLHTEALRVLQEPAKLLEESTLTVTSEQLQDELTNYPALLSMQSILLTWVRYKPTLPSLGLFNAIWGPRWKEKWEEIYSYENDDPADKFQDAIKEKFPESWRHRHFNQQKNYDGRGHKALRYLLVPPSGRAADSHLHESLKNTVILIASFTNERAEMFRIDATIKRFFRLMF